VASEVYPLAVLILVLGIVRTGAVLVFRQEQRLAEYLAERASSRKSSDHRDTPSA
jgi:hypothetical protein